MIWDNTYRASFACQLDTGEKIWEVLSSDGEIMAFPLTKKQAEEIERRLNETVGFCRAVRDCPERVIQDCS